MNSSIKNLGNQPIDDLLREHLPVNYYLFTLVFQGVVEDNNLKLSAESSFHHTTEYYTYPFYKSISYVL